MSDEPKGISFQGEPSGQPENKEGKPVEYLTRQEAERLKADILEDVKRQTQSLTDRASSRIEKRVQDELKKFDEVVKIQKQAGIEIDQATLKNLRNEIVTNALTQVEDQPAPAMQSGQPPSSTEQALIAFTNQAAEAIAEELGVTLEKDDPEAKLVNHDSPKAFLSSLRKATEAKKQRLEQSPASDVRVPTMNVGSPSVGSLTEQYKSEMLANRGTGLPKMREIKEKYRKMGVDVDNTTLR